MFMFFAGLYWILAFTHGITEWRFQRDMYGWDPGFFRALYCIALNTIVFPWHVVKDLFDTW